MPLRIAYPTRVGGEVELDARDWREVARVLSRQYPLGPEIAGVIEDALAQTQESHPRIWLTHAQIEQVRQVVS